MCVCGFKQKAAYEMRMSDWSSDVCSSDLSGPAGLPESASAFLRILMDPFAFLASWRELIRAAPALLPPGRPFEMLTHDRPDPACHSRQRGGSGRNRCCHRCRPAGVRSEEHTSELQSLMRISYAVFCLKKKNNNKKI